MIVIFWRSILLLLLVCSGIFLQGQNVKENIIDEWELPRTARDFITMNFPEQKINQAFRKEDEKSKKFETILDNNAKIEFDNLGFWEEVHGNNLSIPTQFIPRKIMEYINEKYPSQKINKIEKESQKYEVKLMDGTDLHFSLKGKFIKTGD